MNETAKKIGLVGLVAMVFGSMIGGGIFNIPQNMAAESALGPVLIAWGITGIGMLFLVLCFKTLSQKRPDLSTGIYAYAREGFGNYIGFNAAWGYWVSAAVGNVAFAIMLNDALAKYFPVLKDHGWQTAVFGIALIWAYNFIVHNGLKGASFLNSVTVILKFVGLIFIVLMMIAYFKVDQLTVDFWGTDIVDAKGAAISIGEQIKAPMLVTLWCFIGIEGAVVISDRARDKHDVGTATMIGFILALLVYASISVLSYGLLSQHELATLENPSAGYVLRQAVGDWMVDFVDIVILISVGGAWLAWTILTAEVPYQAAKEGVLPKFFAKENAAHAPISALFITSSLMTVIMIIVVNTKDVYMAAIDIAGVMILPSYCLSAMFMVKQGKAWNSSKVLIIGVLATLYTLWLLYAAGLIYLLLTSFFYTIGIIFYYLANKRSKVLFTGFEKLLAIGFVAASALSVYAIYAGKVSF